MSVVYGLEVSVSRDGRPLTPGFLYSFDQLGELALEGRPNATRKLLRAAANSDGAVSENVCESTLDLIVARTTACVSELSELTPVRVRRRVETPPGAQAQADWAEFRGVVVGNATCTLFAFHLVLSHSRFEAIVWSERTDELAWLSVHNAALRRLGGVPGVIRVDNCKTAMAQGAGPWGVVNERYATYARTLRFHVDATRPRAPEEKGKVERRVLAHKAGFDPRRRPWPDLVTLQAATDAAVQRSAEKRLCPATGETVWASYQAEQPLLTPLPALLPEPFDLVAQRRVGRDATVAFEGRTYSVPFPLADTMVEVRGCAATVQVFAAGEIVAEHPRATRARIVLEPSHYEGESTDRVIAPVPLGRMGRRMLEIWAMAPERRPIDQYAAYAEVAR